MGLEAVRQKMRLWLEKHPADTNFYDDELPFPKSFSEQKQIAHAIMTEVMVENNYTPDMHRPGVASRKHIPVFVYGRHKKGLPAHENLAKAGGVYVGEAFTMMKFCQLYTHKEGFKFPMAVARADKGARIKGEIYLLPLDTLMMLDYEHRNGVECKRVSHMFYTVNSSDPKNPTYPSMLAWMYMYRPAYIDGLAKAGVVKPLIPLTRKRALPKETSTEYFSFLKTELAHEYKNNKNRKLVDPLPGTRNPAY